jgi:hypothetical protein
VIVANIESTKLAMRGGLLPGDIFVEVEGVQFDGGWVMPNKLALVVGRPQGSRVSMVQNVRVRHWTSYSRGNPSR